MTEKRLFLQQAVMQKLNLCINERDQNIAPYIKINLKCIKDLNLRLDIIKLLPKTQAKQTLIQSTATFFFASVSQGKENKSKNKSDVLLIKLKSLCILKETISKMKRHFTNWERIFANNATNKVLISKIYKQLIQLNIKKKCTENLNRHFSKEDTQMANRHMKTKFLTPVGMAIIKNSKINKFWRRCEKRDPSHKVNGNVNWCSHCEEQYGGSIKYLKKSCHIIQ